MFKKFIILSLLSLSFFNSYSAEIKRAAESPAGPNTVTEKEYLTNSLKKRLNDTEALYRSRASSTISPEQVQSLYCEIQEVFETCVEKNIDSLIQKLHNMTVLILRPLMNLNNEISRKFYVDLSSKITKKLMG